MSPHRRLPVSTRHAFALAFDLAFRRDPVHSLIVPLLLRAPWAVAGALLPDPDSVSDLTASTLMFASTVLVGDFITYLVVTAMLRVRARTVYGAPGDVRPLRAWKCYDEGLRRIPWLFITESVRNFALALVASFSILPTLFMRLSSETFFEEFGWNLLLLVLAACVTLPIVLSSCRLAVATESVVLDEKDLGSAFVHSFRLMNGRFERWFELMAGSALIVLVVTLLCAALTFPFPILLGTTGLAMLWLLIIAITPVIQYAWTFFYLRLVESDRPLQEVGPTYAAAEQGLDARG